MARRWSIILQVLALAAFLLVSGLQGGRLSEEDLAELDLTEEERAVLRMQGQESDDGFEYNPDGKKGGGPDEEDVVILVPDEYRSFVESKRYVLVQFHAPWCGHCLKLAPEFAKAATALKEKDVVLAKVDAVEHMDFAVDEGVKGYPTLFFYANGIKKPYSGGRSSEEIISWVEKRLGPAVSIIKSAEQVLNSESPVVIAYLESVDGNDAQEFIAAALEDGVEFHMTADAGIAKKFGLDKKAPALVLLKKENEKVATFDGLFKTKAINDFVLENKLPLVIPFSSETANIVFNAGVKNQMLLFTDSVEFEKMRGDYEAAARSFKNKIIFVFVDLGDVDAASPVLEFFALDNEKTRLLAYVADRSGSKYLYDGDYSIDSLKQFSEKFLVQNLTPYLKSQKPPAENPGPVKIVVASTFKEIVLDESKDVILEFYAPWCGACKSLEPEYSKLGEALKHTPSIVVAKIDGTKNEIEGLKMEEYPTVLFYPATKGAEPTSLGTRSAAGYIKFLKSNAKISFEVPDVPEPEDETDSEEEADQDEAGMKDEL